MSIREILRALQLGVASHWERPRHFILIAVGFLIAGLTLTLLLAIPAGLLRLGEATGRDDVAIVSSASATSEAGSTLAPEAIALVSNLPGVARDTQGHPQVAPQFLAYAKLRRINGTPASVLMRGITPATWSLLGGDARLSSGNLFTAGNECIAGATAARAFSALDIGAHVKVREAIWYVSGGLAAPGLWASELWADMTALQATFNASNAISILWVKLESADALTTFNAALRADPRLAEVRAELQHDYYARQTTVFAYYALVASLGIGLVLGIGAILAIANALSLALLARSRELALLRAVGFGRATLFFALLTETAVVGLTVAATAVVVIRFTLNGLEIGTASGSGQAISVALSITPEVAAAALTYTFLLGIAAAIWPAHKAVCKPLIAALGCD